MGHVIGFFLVAALLSGCVVYTDPYSYRGGYHGDRGWHERYDHDGRYR